VKPAAGAGKVGDALAARGVDCEILAFPRTTRTSAEAAAAIGCEVAQIAKSLIFKGGRSARPILVIASGANRVDTDKLAALAGEAIEMPDAGFVRARTGFAIGGVPPVAHAEPLDTYIDRDLMRLDEIWASAGTPFTVFRLTPAILLALTGGRIAEVKK
jgi:prolyl-tRNA editing enzyme YbaK/EbsC (Cys-tRNA(Pro) deacylase)